MFNFFQCSNGRLRICQDTLSIRGLRARQAYIFSNLHLNKFVILENVLFDPICLDLNEFGLPRGLITFKFQRARVAVSY